MKKLHSFIVKSYIGPFVLTFFIVLFLLLMQFLWKYIDDLAGKGLEWYVISELLVYASASLVPMALPLAILMASLMAFGNLGENYELTALKSSGISLQRIMFPLIILTLVLSFLAFLFSNHVLPFANLKMRTLLYDVRHQRLELQLKEGVFYNGIDGYSIKIEKKDKKTNLLKDVKIYDHTDNAGNIKVTIADSGYMKLTANEEHLMVMLFDGSSYNEVQEISKKRNRRQAPTYPHRRDKFKKKVFFMPLDGFNFERTDERLFKNHYQMLNLKQLEYAHDSLTGIYDRRLGSFQESLIKGNFFRKERSATYNIKKKEKKINDTLKFDMDSVFNSLSPSERKTAVNQSLIYARSTKSSLSSSKDELHSWDIKIKKHEIEWHRKFTLSFACFIFFFIGAPLGSIIRKGGLGMPVVISILFFLLYYMISISGEKFVKEGLWHPFSGMWLSSFILFPLGVFLTYKATHDSSILNLEAYSNYFRRLFKLDSMAYNVVIPEEKILDHETSTESYILSLRSAIFKAKKCLVETDDLYPVILRNYSMLLNHNSLFAGFSEQYKELTQSLLKSKYFKIDHFKSKLFELPLFDISSTKYKNKNYAISVMLFILLPLKVIQIVISLIKIQLLKNKFRNIIVSLQDLLSIIENPYLYQKFQD